ncbi:transcription factor E2F6-like [Histomonas meleagridis]|nr:transcription factor E2F6-like [Histomonas meleagridis]
MADKQTLVHLTQGFVRILTEANGNDVELATVEKELRTTKRRLYDVTNVLAGVGLVERSGKSKVRWLGSHTNFGNQFNSQLSQKEMEINRLTAEVDNELADLSNSELFATCAWIDPSDAELIEPDQSIDLYALTGPPKMVIQWKGPDSVLVCKVDPSEGEIQLTPIRGEKF